MPRYKIVTSKHGGYRIMAKEWYWPWWSDYSHPLAKPLMTEEEAKQRLERWKAMDAFKPTTVYEE